MGRGSVALKHNTLLSGGCELESENSDDDILPTEAIFWVVGFDCTLCLLSYIGATRPAMARGVTPAVMIDEKAVAPL